MMNSIFSLALIIAIIVLVILVTTKALKKNELNERLGKIQDKMDELSSKNK